MFRILGFVAKLGVLAVVGLVIFKIGLYALAIPLAAKFADDSTRTPKCYEEMRGLTHQPGCEWKK